MFPHELSLADDCHMPLQLMDNDGGQHLERGESAASESCDIMTATSNLSDEVSGELTAERKRELWRRAHDRPECRDVRKHQTSHCKLQIRPWIRYLLESNQPSVFQVTESSANDSPSESFAPPTESTALGLGICSTPHCSLSQSGELSIQRRVR